LTSGHLAWGALNLGARVTLLYRRTLQESLFDTDPGWLGPKYLKQFHAEPNWDTRWAMVQSARNGGSLTPELMTQLRQAQKSGILQIQEDCQVQQIWWQGSEWKILCREGTSFHVNRIWLATGYRFDVSADPVWQDLRQQHPVQEVGGLPVLEEDLRWPGCHLYVMGGLTALQLGPAARNLWGARLASERIVPSLIHPPILSGVSA
jgi:glycine/D-amino acid oxidase-like deaminating enzyme